MAIGSPFLSANESQTARKRVVPLGEFILSLFIVMAAALVGVVGGIWLAERDRSTGRPETVSSRASVQHNSQPLSMPPETRKAKQASTLVPAAEATEAAGASTLLGLPSVLALHHSYGPDYTEIAIELRGAVLLRAAQLHDPERVYFDIGDNGRTQRSKGRLRSHREVSVSDDRVIRVRISCWESGSVRVVLDLKRPCKYSYRLSPGPPSRLILALSAQPSGTVARNVPSAMEVARNPENLGADHR